MAALAMFLFCIVLCGLATTGTRAAKPGVKVRITQHALNYANQQALDALVAKIPSTHIPDQSGRAGILRYSLTSIRIAHFDKPYSSIDLVPNTGLSWSGDKLGIKLHSDWHAEIKKWIKISFSGHLDVSITGVSFKETVAVVADSTGRPYVKSTGCICSVGDVDIDISGDMGSFLHLFKSRINKHVRDLIPGKLCDLMNDQINNKAESKLRNLKVMTPLMGNKFMLDYQLVTSPDFHTTYMETSHKGEITWAANSQPPLLSPEAFSASSSTSKMLYLWIGKYVPQSFAYAAQKNGFLKYNLTAKDLSPELRGFLNTTCNTLTCVGRLVPAIRKKYPGCIVEMHMKSTAVPVVNMSPNVLEAKFAGDIDIYVNTSSPSGKIPYLLTLSVSFSANLTAAVSNQVIVGNVSDSSFEVVVKKSAIGPVNSKVVNTMLRFVMKFFIIPKLNEQGSHGFPLPVANVKFMDTELHIQQDALMIGTDLQYTIH